MYFEQYAVELQSHIDVDNKNKYVLEVKERNSWGGLWLVFLLHCQQEASNHMLSPISII